MVSQVTASAAPWRDAPYLGGSARYALWAKWLNSLLDEDGERTPESFREVQVAVEVGLCSGPRPIGRLTHVASHLDGLCELFEKSRAADVVLPAFKERLAHEVEARGRLFEAGRRFRLSGVLPPVEDALVDGAKATFTSSRSMAFFMMLGEAIKLRTFGEVCVALEAAGVAIRLANDLMNRSKDEAEGLINIASYGWSSERATHEIAACVKEFEARIERLVALGGPVRSLRALRRLEHLRLKCLEIDDSRYP
jgi:hypothetical protein